MGHEMYISRRRGFLAHMPFGLETRWRWRSIRPVDTRARLYLMVAPKKDGGLGKEMSVLEPLEHSVLDYPWKVVMYVETK